MTMYLGKIKPHEPVVTLKQRQYKTDDIIREVQEVLRTDRDDTAEFSKDIPRTIDGLKMLFDFVFSHFTYVEDPDNNQWVQTPSFLAYTRRGDCKSFTVFISSVLQNMGISHIIRYVAYPGSRAIKHVYPVAILDGREVPMDVVWAKQEGGPFGREKKYSYKKDFKVEGLYKLGTTAQEYVGQVQTTLEELQSAMADIPDSIVTSGPGDITTFTKGEMDRYIWQERYEIFARQEPDPTRAGQYRAAASAMERGSIAGISGISGNDPFSIQVQNILAQAQKDTGLAFKPFTIQIPNPVIQDAKMNGFLQDVGKFFKKVGDTIADLFKKLVNWIFKGVAQGMGPYFIFLFANKGQVKSPEIKRRIDAQQKTFDWIAKIGRLNKDQLMGAVLNGIKEKTSLTPPQIFTEGGTPEISGLVLSTVLDKVIQAIGVVIEVIGKIISLFKKNNDAGDVSKGNMSDVTLLEQEATLQKQAATTGGGGTGSGGGGLILPALAALGYFAFR